MRRRIQAFACLALATAFNRTDAFAAPAAR